MSVHSQRKLECIMIQIKPLFIKRGPITGLALASLIFSSIALAGQPNSEVNRNDLSNPDHPSNQAIPKTKAEVIVEHQARAAEIKQAAVENASNEWAITLKSGQNIEDIATQYGAESYKQVGSLKNVYLLTIPNSATQAKSTRDALRSAPGIKGVTQQVSRHQNKRVAFTDPLYSAQWHLDRANDTNFGSPVGTYFPGTDANVVSAWDGELVDGTGITIGIVDDGLQHTHPDLSPNYNANASWDYNSDNADPAPNSPADSHGTSVAGVAGAADDGAKCGVGAAYNATLAGLQLISGATTDAIEAAALSYTELGVTDKNTIDIFNNSWGPPDDGTVQDYGWGAGPLTLAALADGVNNGRNGKGVIYVWAGGNGRTSQDDVNYDNFANSLYTIAVGAVRPTGVLGDGSDGGEYSYYSEPGAALHIVAPSSDQWTGEGIRTTDLLGSDGNNAGADSSGDADCRDSFGGTSSASPLMAGIIALMLDANTNLGWRDVQHILAETAVKNDPTETDWSVNGGGFHINHNYGFGLVDTQAAVAAAKTWTNVPTALSVDTGVKVLNTAIPDGTAAVVGSYGLPVTDSFVVSENITLEHVEIVYTGTHTYRGDLRIVLTSPNGTQSVLANDRLTDNRNDFNAWKFMSVRNWGESSSGTWTISVSDGYQGDTGSFTSWQLILHGTDTTPPAAPGVPDMTAATDNGVSDTDNLTGVTTPSFTGTAEANSTVTLISSVDGTIGSATADGSGNWTITASVLTEGAHNITATATDASGNTSAASSALAITIVKITLVTPTITGMSSESDSGVSNTDNITNDTTPVFTGTAEANSTVTMISSLGGNVGSTTADGSGNWSLMATLTEGVHKISANSSDGWGNTSATTSTLSVTIDTSIPAPTIPDMTGDTDTGNSSTDNITSDTTPSFTGLAEANSTVTLTSSVDGTVGSTTADNSGNWSIDATVLTEGVHEVTAISTDIAGNVSAASSALSINIDILAAAPIILNMVSDVDTSLPSVDNITYDTTPGFTGVAEANDLVILTSSVDGTVGTTTTDSMGNWIITTSVLTEGAHNITAIATDVAGNTSVASSVFTISIDTTVTTPGLPDMTDNTDTGSSSTDNLSNDTTPGFTGTAASSSTVTLISSVDGTVGSATADGTGSWDITTEELSEGMHEITATSTNGAGDTSTASSALSINIDTSVATPSTPDMTSDSDNGSSSTDNVTSDTTPNFTGTAEANSTVTLTSSIDGDVGTTTADAMGNWIITTSELTEETHDITATASDEAGNVSEASPALNITIDVPAKTGSGGGSINPLWLLLTGLFRLKRFRLTRETNI